MTGRPPLIVDCDPGLDDAIALLTAAHFTDLVAIATVNGNVGLEFTTRNAISVATVADLAAEIHSGAAAPLVADPLDAAEIHGVSGLGDWVAPPPGREVESTDAVEYLLRHTTDNDGVHVAAIGPLTNIALALRADPDFANRVSSLTVMGGALEAGNVTPHAEFNIWADPEAAAEVFAVTRWGQTPLTMIGLEVTHQVCLTQHHVDRLQGHGPVAAMAADLISYAIETNRQQSFEEGAPIHDACAIIALTHPHLFSGSHYPLSVASLDQPNRGQTFIESTGPVSAYVPTTVDADAVVELIIEAVLAIDAR